jgi:septal ring factor EnvC (AmiA/AmiB activator)
LEREVVSLQTHKVVLQQQLSQREGQLRELRDAQNGVVGLGAGNGGQIAALVESVNRLQTSMDGLSRDMNERLNRLESRLNSLVIGDNQSVVSLDANLALREEMRNQMEQQRKDLERERKAYLLSFSDMFKKAAEGLEIPASSSSSSRDMNGPLK